MGPGLHQKLVECSKTLFYGAFSKPLYCGGEGGIPHRPHPKRLKPRENKARRTRGSSSVYHACVPQNDTGGLNFMSRNSLWLRGDFAVVGLGAEYPCRADARPWVQAVRRLTHRSRPCSLIMMQRDGAVVARSVKLFGSHETLGATALFALVHAMDKSRLLSFGAGKTHFLTTLDAIWRIMQRL